MDIPAEKRLFLFWQCRPGTPVPGYISLCLETLIKFNPDYRIIFLNYDNIYAVLDDNIDWLKLVKMKLPQQSDILMTNVLARYGGHTIDVDMIYTGSIDWLNSFPSQTLVGFGTPNVYMHCSLMSAVSPNNPILLRFRDMQGVKVSQESLERLAYTPWDFVGNSIIDPIIQSLGESGDVRVISNSSFLMETSFDFPRKVNLSYGIELYRRFWFEENDIAIADIIARPEYGIIFLHNSWMPKDILTMNASEFINQDFPMARLFRELLSCNEIDENTLIKIPFSTYYIKKNAKRRSQ